MTCMTLGRCQEHWQRTASSLRLTNLQLINWLVTKGGEPARARPEITRWQNSLSLHNAWSLETAWAGALLSYFAPHVFPLRENISKPESREDAAKVAPLLADETGVLITGLFSLAHGDEIGRKTHFSINTLLFFDPVENLFPPPSTQPKAEAALWIFIFCLPPGDCENCQSTKSLRTVGKVSCPILSWFTKFLTDK